MEFRKLIKSSRASADCSFRHSEIGLQRHSLCWQLFDRFSRRVPGPELKSMIMVESVREMGGKRTSERRFYISSLAPDSRKIGDAIRAHWGIESKLALVPCCHVQGKRLSNAHGSRGRELQYD